MLGAGIPLILVAFNTLVQKQTPGRLMGRVSTSIEVLVTTPQAVSIAVGALLVTLLDYRVIFALMTAGTAVAAGYLAVRLREHLGSPIPGAATEARRAIRRGADPGTALAEPWVPTPPRADGP